MHRLSRAARWLANGVGVLGAAGIIVMMVHITADVVARLTFGSPLIGTNEIVSRYYMIAVTFLPLAWVEHQKAMIAVELFDAQMSRRTLALSDGLVALTSAGVLALLTWASWHEAVRAFASGSFVMAIGNRIPVWPTYFFIPAGAFLAILLVILRLLLLVMPQTTPSPSKDPL